MVWRSDWLPALSGGSALARALVLLSSVVFSMFSYLSEGSVAWMRSPQHLCNKLLDSALSRDIADATVTDQFDLVG